MSKNKTTLTLIILCLAWGLYFTACLNLNEPVSKIQQTPSYDLAEVEWVSKIMDAESHPATMRPPSTGRVCKKSDWNKSQGEIDTIHYETFYLVMHRNKNGYWHNPVGDFAITYYDLDGIPFLWKSYNNQKSEDVVQRIRGNVTRYPASVRISDTVMTIIHRQNTYETDIVNNKENIPAVIKLNAYTMDTLCVGHYDCAKYISGCTFYPGDL